MGMFDSLYVRCQCGKDIEFQTKAGPRELKAYRLEDVPPSVAGDLNGQIEECGHCGQSYRIHTVTFTQAIPL